ncbi:MAG: hypothetical protein AABY09_06075, partial [Nanoarchaeota archaeon]
FMQTHLEGIVTMEGLCEEAQVMDGSLVLFKDMKLSYGFKFMTERGLMHYRGNKFLSLKHPLKSMTTLYGEITGDIVHQEYKNQALSFFRMSDLPAFMLSFVQSARF